MHYAKFNAEVFLLAKFFWYVTHCKGLHILKLYPLKILMVTSI
jgi:hypothetical protein